VDPLGQAAPSPLQYCTDFGASPTPSLIATSDPI
jgi:hypothetical protein